jgi:GTP cyclohydrolase II
MFPRSYYIGVERGLAEFRCGRPVVILGDQCVAAMPVDGCSNELLQWFRVAFDVTAVKLAVSARRAYALGIKTQTPVSIETSKELTIHDVLAVAGEKSLPRGVHITRAAKSIRAGIDLAKLAGRLPAVLTAQVRSVERQGNIFAKFEAAAVSGFRQHLVDSLEVAASSAMTLDGVEAARLVVFRNAISSEPVALIVGHLDLSRPVLVRLHSECLSGDVFGSRRCDCGDQLRLAFSQMQSTGGIVLYLRQEGRGVGLLNKVRAYGLQDAGLDTVEANMTLGFEIDERDYRVAGRMLQLLGCQRVLLLTNNPAKLAGLAETGIEICGRGRFMRQSPQAIGGYWRRWRSGQAIARLRMAPTRHCRNEVLEYSISLTNPGKKPADGISPFVRARNEVKKVAAQSPHKSANDRLGRGVGGREHSR